MAYEKQTWQTGDVITQEKLNHMEDGIAEGGSCDCGFECSDARATLFEETVTTVVQEGYNAATFAYSALITADTLIVTFDGVEYTCSRISPTDGVNGYGGIGASGAEFSEFPFAILSTPTGNTLAAETAGEHTVKAETITTAVTTTECFKAAVNSAVSPLVVHRFNGFLDKTWREISNALMGQGAVIATQINEEGDYTVLPILSAYVEESGESKSYKVSFYEGDPMYKYSVSSPDGYPSAGQE